VGTTESPDVWFITGCSTGLGRELARAALAAGAHVVATARDPATLAGLAPQQDERFLALALDVTREAQREQALAAALARFGRIDVLVHNAGYGYQATVEEGDDGQVRAMFETNVFAVFALTRQVLPIMRRQRRGQVVTIGSVAGLFGLAGSGYYAAAKHALEGWTDSLAAEIEPLGLRASCVEPGPVRTDFASRSLRQTIPAIDDYAATAGVRLKALREASGRQAGDPRRCAELIVKLASEQRLPRHLVLGRSAARLAIEHAERVATQLRDWEDTSGSTDFA
jgi:NAD(P)-dependent dehydrogenase (short-subunit alcohol dehydrogenase family)